MSERFRTGPGMVLSADIAVPEHEREVRFSARVLTTGAEPLWQDDLMNNRGVPVIGLGERIPEYEGLPLQWMPHIQVADVAASAVRAVELGGRELMHHRDESGTSQWAVLEDPGGAAFGIIPVVLADAIPAILPGPMGRIAWLDLTVGDAPERRDFYREVIGWAVQELAMGPEDDRYADYVMVAADGEGAAGVCHALGPNVGLPSVWLLYLPVGDLAVSLDRVTEEGGAVLRVSKNEDGAPVYAVVRDPVGAWFALVPGRS
jgi:predicted enzyme related to lactoylglutathione lyase